MDRLRSIEMLVRAVEAGTLTAAADAMHLSPAAVSRGVADLEAHLGTRLVQRSSRRLSLTEGGAQFVEQARRVLEAMSEAEAVATASLVHPRGTLRLNVPLTFGILHLAPLWPRFLAAYPDLELDVSLTDRVVDLLEEGFDLGVRISRLQDSSLVAKKLATTRMVLCAAPAYLERHGAPASPAELTRHACLSYTYLNSRDAWTLNSRGDGREHRIAVDCRMHANNGDTIRAAALAGAGIVLQPTFLVGADVAAGRLVEVLPEFESIRLGVYAVYPTRKHLPAKVRVLMDFLAGALGSDPDADPWDVARPSSRPAGARQRTAVSAPRRGRG